MRISNNYILHLWGNWHSSTFNDAITEEVSSLISILLLFFILIYIYIYIYIYTRVGSYDEIIPVVDDFLTNGIHALQYWWQKCMNHEEDYIEKSTLFGHIPWEYLGQPVNFSVNSCIYSYTHEYVGCILFFKYVYLNRTDPFIRSLFCWKWVIWPLRIEWI